MCKKKITYYEFFLQTEYTSEKFIRINGEEKTEISKWSYNGSWLVYGEKIKVKNDSIFTDYDKKKYYAAKTVLKIFEDSATVLNFKRCTDRLSKKLDDISSKNIDK